MNNLEKENIHQLLLLLHKEFSKGGHLGLCSAVQTLLINDVISKFRGRLINDYIEENSNDLIYGYSFNKKLILFPKINGHITYWFKPGEMKPRLKWLTQHLLLTSK